jgi:hypothetical protein
MPPEAEGKKKMMLMEAKTSMFLMDSASLTTEEHLPEHSAAFVLKGQKAPSFERQN